MAIRKNSLTLIERRAAAVRISGGLWLLAKTLPCRSTNCPLLRMRSSVSRLTSPGSILWNICSSSLVKVVLHHFPASLSRNTTTLTGRLNPASAAAKDRQERSEAVILNSFRTWYSNVDQNDQSYLCKRVDEKVC